MNFTRNGDTQILRGWLGANVTLPPSLRCPSIPQPPGGVIIASIVGQW